MQLRTIAILLSRLHLIRHMKNVMRLETCCTLRARDIGWMQGITNMTSVIPRVLGVALVGMIFDQTHSWNVRKKP
jgi:hypothetical protein